MGTRRRVEAERGDTLIELVLSIVILGVAAVGIFSGITLSIQLSDVHRKQTTTSVYLRRYAEAIENDIVTSGYQASCTPNLTDTNVRSTVALRDVAGSAYNADGAAQVAVNTLRKNAFDNDTSSPTLPKCFGTSDTLVLPNFYPSTKGQHGTARSSAAVTCTAEAGSGAQGTPVPISSANKPGQAILTLGQSSGETGQVYGQSNKPVTIRGAVTSNSTINSNSAQLTVVGGAQVKAVGVCSGSITPACTTIGTPLGDPNYPAPTVAPAPPASMPACDNSNKNKIADFLPGLYTDANFLSNCIASWMYFEPGTYYFDFPSSAPIWTLNMSAVGGALVGAKTNTAPAVPGACVNPISSTTAVGVEFVFGGPSQLSYAKGVQAEFCASYSATSEMSLFGNQLVARIPRHETRVRPWAPRNPSVAGRGRLLPALSLRT